MEQIKLVVLNNHTLGYLYPGNHNAVHVLYASILKGAVNDGTHGSLHFNSKVDTIRLASKQDFDDFRVSFVGFENEQEYEYKK